MWCGDSIVFAENSTDYFVSAAGVQEVEHEKPYEQITAYCQGTGPSFVGLYNEGFDDPGYLMFVDTSSPNGFDRKKVRGAFLIAGNDGADLYGTGYRAVGNPDYEDSTTAHNEQGQHFSRLTGSTDDKEHPSYITTYQSHGATERLIPGPEDRMYAISCREEVSGVTARLVLDSWAKANGEYRYAPLTDAKGQNLLPIDAQACAMLHTGTLVDRDTLIWFSGDGQGWETQLPSGQSRKLYSINRDLTSDVTTQLDTTSDVLAVLAADGEDNDEWSVRFLDLRTGQHLHTVDLPQLSEYYIGEREVEGFNVRPDIAERLHQLKSNG